MPMSSAREPCFNRNLSRSERTVFAQSISKTEF